MAMLVLQKTFGGGGSTCSPEEHLHLTKNKSSFSFTERLPYLPAESSSSGSLLHGRKGWASADSH